MKTMDNERRMQREMYKLKCQVNHLLAWKKSCEEEAAKQGQAAAEQGRAFDASLKQAQADSDASQKQFQSSFDQHVQEQVNRKEKE